MRHPGERAAFIATVSALVFSTGVVFVACGGDGGTQPPANPGDAQAGPDADGAPDAGGLDTVAPADDGPPPDGEHRHHVIEIDIDDHGLAGLWMANAPNLKGLIARGTLAFSRVVVPTHSNQNNMALLTGQYPEGNNVPANGWLAREAGFVPPVNLPGLVVGDYALYDHNPLLVRGDSVYRAVHGALLRSAYLGELPPFEAGADNVHLSVVGAPLGGFVVNAFLAKMLLGSVLRYPASVLANYQFDGPPNPGESFTRYTLRDAAALVRASSAAAPLADFMFVWDFLALDEDPTSKSGAAGADVQKIIEDYDAGLGELLQALAERGVLDDTDILFTLDHGKVDTHNQVVLGTRGGPTADGQLGALVAAKGASAGLSPSDYAILNEDGDGQIYAAVANAGTPAAGARQAEVTHALLSLIQSGEIMGLDPTRTMTADGAQGTRRFHDFRTSSPNQADIIVFPQDDWTLNQVDPMNAQPGPFREHAAPYGRHGGFSVDELYVPLILAGPSFKKGVLLPHPVEHPAIAPTAMAALGKIGLGTAACPPITAALLGDPGETVALPAAPDTARAVVLAGSGYSGTPHLAAAPATAAVIIDVAGVYDDELFADATLADAAQPLRALAAGGTRFEGFWTRSRDWPVTEFEMLAGGRPVAPWFPAAEDDPTRAIAPGQGLLQMPPAVHWIADAQAYQAWRQPAQIAGATLLDTARSLGLTTALIGQPDFHDLHVDPTKIDVRLPSDAAGAAGAVQTLLQQHPRALAVVAIGSARSHEQRIAADGPAQLHVLAAAAAAIAQAAPGALILITSRGATVIDDDAADAYGPGSSHHVPFVMLGPNVRSGVVSGQPATPADVPATILFGLGAPMTTDFAQGTWATGVPVAQVPQPSPASATAGHALVRAFQLAPP